MAEARNRPLSPHLTDGFRLHWRWGPAMFVSILHRVTGNGLAVAGLWVTKPPAFCDVDQSRCAICDVGRDDSTMIVPHLRQLCHPWNDKNRLGTGGRLKQTTVNLVRRKRSQRSIELRARRCNLLEDVLRR